MLKNDTEKFTFAMYQCVKHIRNGDMFSAGMEYSIAAQYHMRIPHEGNTRELSSELLYAVKYVVRKKLYM